MDEDKLVRRAPTRPHVWLGEAKEPTVRKRLGARFPATVVKERDFVLDVRQYR